MNKHTALNAGSLLERAAALYDFSAEIRRPVVPPRPEPEIAERPAVSSAPEPVRDELAPRKPDPKIRTASSSGRTGVVDREALEAGGFILPDAPVSGLAEEFQIIKRQLLLGVEGAADIPAEKRRTILVCSAQPDEGKTFSALNLALSLAGEKEIEVLLVDGDFVKPEILSILGLEAGPGLIDAIADGCDVENFVIATDIPGLSVLPAGRQANDVSELLASARAGQVLADLTANYPNRVVIFDSPPALMASPASVLATHVGQVMVVVRADKTIEADLRETVGLLSGCDHLSLMLNGTVLTTSGRRFGAYYGYSQ